VFSLPAKTVLILCDAFVPSQIRISDDGRGERRLETSREYQKHLVTAQSLRGWARAWAVGFG
jgi:hypothetical protein